MIRKHSTICLVSVVAMALGWSVLRAADPESAKEAAPDRAALEKQFEEMLSGATLNGNYTSGQKDANLKQDKYTIEKVSKLAGDLWLFNVRIQYGSKDMTLPLPLNVLWAGDTPSVTLDKESALPGLGSFSARVVFHEGKYAGTWSGGNHGGIVFVASSPVRRVHLDA
jgi:hypothetical protein